MSGSFSRRSFVLGGGALLGGAAAGSSAGPLAAPRSVVPDYAGLSVRPLINCKGSYTIISGSLTLPEVKQAMDQASRQFVHMDELMEGVGARLAQLTGAEWGIVTAGCSAAETLATCACIAGSNPEFLQRIPTDLAGLPNEVIIPRYSRNDYDHGVRMTGVKMVTVDTLDQVEASLSRRTAMVYILAAPEDEGPLGLEPIARLAHRRGVPVFVDAAAEYLTPEVHLKRGADLVAYSGGKIIRGPQCAGLLLGRKDLCRAAWIHSAPHHAFGRSMKVGKEEIMGMLAAVEMWYQRDHEAEERLWLSWMEEIGTAVGPLSGVQTEIVRPPGRKSWQGVLWIRWNGAERGLSGKEVYQELLDGDPRIQLFQFSGDSHQPQPSAVAVRPFMMQPGDERIVSRRLVEVLSRPPSAAPPKPRPPAADISGVWDVEMEFSLGRDRHTFFLEQSEGLVRGTHQGALLKGEITGWMDGSEVYLVSRQAYEGSQLNFSFQGKLQSDILQGDVDLDEYGQARWSARRRFGAA